MTMANDYDDDDRPDDAVTRTSTMAPMTRESDVPTVGPQDSIHNEAGAGLVGPCDDMGDTPNINTASHNSGDIEVNH